MLMATNNPSPSADRSKPGRDASIGASREIRGLVQVYTGDGKGKTTAALGLLMRAVGAGRRVLFTQFLKGGSSSECALLRERFPEVDCRYYGRGVWVRGKPSDTDVEAACKGFDELCESVTGGRYDVVIADEIHHAVSLKMIPVDQMIALIDRKPATVELVLTGRNAHPRILERADLISEIVCRRHPYTRGVQARWGIEY